ncbi:MAG: FAD-dependent monooxygenase [Pseudomonadota bacterium]|nr:FAD-dependent monooxygenase [Pseudomonadota bacterium]
MVQIAVSGGGIAGMAAALAAARSGHEVTLFSGSAPAALVGGLQLAPNGWAALRDLGLTGAAEKLSIRLTEITVRSLGTGSTLIRLPLHDPYASFDRARLAKLLRDALADEGTVTVRAVNLAHINQLSESVSLVTEDGACDSFKGLIAADGGKGLGRRHVTSSQAPRSVSAKLAMRAQIPLSSLPAHFALPSSNLWLGRGMHVVHYPIGSMLNLVVTLPAREANRNWQRRVFLAASPLAALADDNIRWVQTPLAAAETADCWRRGGVVLAGDAAHSMPPHLAQGAGQGLRDAASLRRWLEGAESIDRAFAGYARERAGEVSGIVRKADLSGRIMGLSGPAAGLRDIALNLGGPQLMKSWLAEVWAADPKLA